MPYTIHCEAKATGDSTRGIIPMSGNQSADAGSVKVLFLASSGMLSLRRQELETKNGGLSSQ